MSLTRDHIGWGLDAAAIAFAARAGQVTLSQRVAFLRASCALAGDAPEIAQAAAAFDAGLARGDAAAAQGLMDFVADMVPVPPEPMAEFVEGDWRGRADCGL